MTSLSLFVGHITDSNMLLWSPGCCNCLTGTSFDYYSFYIKVFIPIILLAGCPLSIKSLFNTY
jgi:hypothetical protein